MRCLVVSVTTAAALLSAVSAFGQSNLDKPISTQPTVRSEIGRGQDAAVECNGLGRIGRFRIIEECVSKIVQENVQQQKASSAFKLGMYLVALAQWEAIGASKIHPEDNAPNMVDGNVNVWRSEVKKAMTSLKLTEKEICGAISMKCGAIQASLAAIH
jgi:hypothetical protein